MAKVSRVDVFFSSPFFSSPFFLLHFFSLVSHRPSQSSGHMEIAVLVAAKVVIGYTSLLIGGQGPFEAETMTNTEKHTYPDKVLPHSILSNTKGSNPTIWLTGNCRARFGCVCLSVCVESLFSAHAHVCFVHVSIDRVTCISVPEEDAGGKVVSRRIIIPFTDMDEHIVWWTGT